MNAQLLKWRIDGNPVKGVRAFRINGNVDSSIELTLEMLPGSIEFECEYAMVTKATTNEGPHQG